MSDDTRATALHSFIAELRVAFERAGPPTYARLETLSKRYSDDKQTPGLRVCVLPSSTTHDILNGRRNNLPRWPWVASYVAVLRVAAVENGLDPDAIGTVAQWRCTYQAARAAIHTAMGEGTQPLGAPVPDDDGADDPRLISAATASAWEEQPSSAPTLPLPEPAIVRDHYADAYGRTGMRLLRHAETDQGEGIPAYRLAVLLTCDDRCDEALYWLRRAVAAGHFGARRLAGRLADWQVARVAYDIGVEYEAAGYPYAAAVFFVRAANKGHTEAAYRAGLHYTQIDKRWEAASLFIRAAGNGHVHAQRELDALLSKISLNISRPPSNFPSHR